jgi:hypothetical protein
MQGKRRSAATPYRIRPERVKVRLTLRFYCGKEGCSEAWIRWRAAQIMLFCLEQRSRALQHFVAFGPVRWGQLKAVRNDR